jgi:hypothetical protein
MPKATKKLSDLIPCNYDECGTSVEPTDQEIQQAIEKGDVEKRGMDEHQDQIKAWLLAGSNNGQDKDAVVRMMKEYHTKRVAYWVVTHWPKDDKYPITVNKTNQVTAGNHRVRAALYKMRTACKSGYKPIIEIEVMVAG